LDSSRVVVVVEMARASPRAGHRRPHVHGVEGAGNAELDQTGAVRRVGGERAELLFGSGGHDLAGSVVVGSGQALSFDRGEHLFGNAADDGRHRGRCGRACRRHG
jgi:hypothetical protein